MIHLEEVAYSHSVNSFGFWLLGWNSCWTNAEAVFHYLERLICIGQVCSFWAASQGSRSLLCNITSVWWTEKEPLAVVISLEWSRHCHLKLLIVVILSTTSLAVSMEPPCLCFSRGSLCWSYSSYGCSFQWVTTFMFCACAHPSLVCPVSTCTRVYYLDLQGTSKSVKFSCYCHRGIVSDAVEKPISRGYSVKHCEDQLWFCPPWRS